jgi:hypothetical protein
MDKTIKLQKYTQQFFKDHDIHAKSNVIEQATLYIDAIIFNIVSIFCLIAILNNGTKIVEQTYNAGRQYIDDKCLFNYTKLYAREMNGGSRLGTAAFLGINEPMYDAQNAGSDLLHVNFASGEARPQIGGTATENKLQKLIKTYMNHVLMYHNVTSNKQMKTKMLNLTYFHCMCFLNDLKTHKSPITISMIQKIIDAHKVLRK